MASTSKKIVAEALSRVVTRNMAAGRSLAYEQMLQELEAEVDVLLKKRREREARVLRQAREKVRARQVRLALAAESLAARPADAEVDLLRTLMSGALPKWHPEHKDHPEMM